MGPGSASQDSAATVPVPLFETSPRQRSGVQADQSPRLLHAAGESISETTTHLEEDELSDYDDESLLGELGPDGSSTPETVAVATPAAGRVRPTRRGLANEEMWSSNQIKW